MVKIFNETLTQQLDIIWEPAPDGARILRIYGEHPVLVLPDYIEGLPVTEIGPYCFSRSEPKLPEHPFHYHINQKETGSTPLSCLSGSVVEAISLPSSITTLHNAAFYNCRNLHTLSVGTQIRSIGSDEFMNCTQLSKLIMRGTDTEANGLALLLERFAENLLVLFQSSDFFTAALFFPEYYEWLDEISPAHIFSRSIHGEGFRMRKCFEDGKVNYEKYDQCMENALKVESKETLCLISITRLRWPNGLLSDARIVYEQVLHENMSIAINMAIKEKDLDQLVFLCSYWSDSDYTQAITACINADWSEGSARLMEEKHQNGGFADKQFSFDDFEDF